jgi:hypothetical protein
MVCAICGGDAFIAHQTDDRNSLEEMLCNERACLLSGSGKGPLCFFNDFY